MSVPVRAVGLLALGAFGPITMFYLGSLQIGHVSAVFTAVNVILITTSLFLLFGPAPVDGTHGNGTVH